MSSCLVRRDVCGVIGSWTNCEMASHLLKLNTGALMPAVGLGTWKSTKGAVGKAIKIALGCGYRHIDCAHVYHNEEEIGGVLKEVFSVGELNREEVFITSKLWSDMHAPDDVLEACQITLKNLQLDYLDLYLVHLPLAFKKGSGLVLGYSPERMQKTWKAMENLVDKGLCKAIGISNFTTKKINTLLETARIVPSCNQVEMHPYLPQPKLKAFCESKGILVAAYSPLGSPDRPYSNKEAEPIVMNEPVLKEIAQKHSWSVALVALAWGVQRGTPVLPKAVSENHIKENLTALELTLDAEDLAAIDGIAIHHRYLKQTWMYKPKEVPADYWDGEE